MSSRRNKKRTKAARQARFEATYANVGRKAASKLRASAPPLNPIDAPPAAPNREVIPVDRMNIQPGLFGQRKRKRTSCSIAETGRKVPRSDIALIRPAEGAFLKCLDKWHAVCLFVEQRGKNGGKVTNSQAALIGAKYGVEGQTVRDWVMKMESGHSLLRNDGSGNKITKFDVANRCLHEVFDEYGGELSQLCLTHLIQREGLAVSKQTVQRILDGPDWTVVKMKPIPNNTEANRIERVKFATENLNNSFGGDGKDTLYIDIDEKNFKCFGDNRIVYCPTELAHTFETFNAATKSSKEMVMFFAAVARPRPARDFDGKVLLLPITTKKTMKRNSKYAKRDEIVDEPTTLDKKGFIKICTDDLLSSIRTVVKGLPEVKKVEVQMDRAGGHGGGRGDMKGILKELNNKGLKGDIPVTFKTQSAKSPDFNALDLGAWYSLSSGVTVIKADKNATKKVSMRIIEEVKRRWEEWDAMTRLENIFATKTRVMKAVLDAQGDIRYKMPRSGKSHKNELPAHLPKKERLKQTVIVALPL